MFSLIVAMDQNGVIGKDNNLPWHLPNDLKRVKELTTNNVIILGRKNFESIGKPLPNRLNVVLTRDKNLQIDGCQVNHSLEEVMSEFKDDPREIFIFGGTEIYQLFLPYVHKMYITQIHHTFDGDTYFPSFNKAEWTTVSEKEGQVDERNIYQHTFYVLQRNSLN
ncbi:dihydrofolate reductase [Ectobacillus funiculus]|uniref:Dihydrofolate reductase n=1 Tax=Ectobacillus funiculus TaxID=137993 RepID=A0ABV5WC74_9BACI